MMHNIVKNLRDQARSYALPLILYQYRAYRQRGVGSQLLFESKSPSQCSKMAYCLSLLRMSPIRHS
jgi:hypothetical protein